VPPIATAIGINSEMARSLQAFDWHGFELHKDGSMEAILEFFTLLILELILGALSLLLIKILEFYDPF
jgi:hypothetical protein